MKVKHTGWIILLCTTFILLTGCMYPKDRLMENQLSPMDQVAMVQKGIDEFFAEKQILPIQTKEQDTPIYEKYVINLEQMVPKYIPYVPGAAFEKGGSYLFVLVNAETKPTVKLLDLRLVDKVGEVQSRVSYYYDKKKALPVAGVVKPGFFTINFKEIGLTQDEHVESPFSGDALPIIMTSTGIVGIDYQKDLEKTLKGNHINLSKDQDVREILPQNSLYVPVKSFAYHLENGRPTLFVKP